MSDRARAIVAPASHGGPGPGRAIALPATNGVEITRWIVRLSTADEAGLARSRIALPTADMSAVTAGIILVAASNGGPIAGRDTVVAQVCMRSGVTAALGHPGSGSPQRSCKSRCTPRDRETGSINGDAADEELIIVRTEDSP